MDAILWENNVQIGLLRVKNLRGGCFLPSDGTSDVKDVIERAPIFEIELIDGKGRASSGLNRDESILFCLMSKTWPEFFFANGGPFFPVLDGTHFRFSSRNNDLCTAEG